MRYDIWGPLLRHLEISLLGVLLGCVVGIGLGALLRKRPPHRLGGDGDCGRHSNRTHHGHALHAEIVFGSTTRRIVIAIFL